MSRLDEHVRSVRLKLTLSRFVNTLPWAGTILASFLFAVIAAEHLTDWQLRRPEIWFWAGVGITIVASLVYAILRRPTTHQAAVAIDERLGLQEKFSTALYVRASNDPFAAATVRDAEQAAAGANLGDKFRIEFPQRWTVRLVVAVAIAIGTMYLPHYSIATSQATTKAVASHVITARAAEQMARAAIAEAEAAPREVTDNDQVKMALGEVQRNLDEHVADPTRTQQTAKDLQDKIQAMKQKIAESQKFATARSERDLIRNIEGPSPSETGPVSDAARALAGGNEAAAIDNLKKAVDKFSSMDKAEQEKAAKQMEDLAKQVAQKANDPKVQQAVQDALQQAGVDPKAAKDIADKARDAANGDKQAQQQMQQMANQAIQNATQQAGMSQQQQQAVANAIKNAVNQAQQQSNGQANAQQMAQTMQNLAQAMKQAAQNQPQPGQNPQQSGAQANAGQPKPQPGQQGGPKPGQQGGQQPGQQPGQQAGQQASQQGGQQAGQQPGSQQTAQAGQGSQAPAQASAAGQQSTPGQAGASQQAGPGQQPGQQPGQSQQAGQASAGTAQQAMQQQMAQLSAMAKDSQGVAAAQQNAAQGTGSQPGQSNSGSNNNGSNGQVATGQWGQPQQGNQGQANGQPGGNNPQPGANGQQGPANGAFGRRPDPVLAPAGFKPEYSESHTNEDGKIIASSFVKASTVVGESKMKLGKAIDSQTKDDASEVESDRVPRSQQKAVKDYFDTLKQQ